jgi:hypothetical protein
MSAVLPDPEHPFHFVCGRVVPADRLVTLGGEVELPTGVEDVVGALPVPGSMRRISFMARTSIIEMPTPGLATNASSRQA